MTQRVFNMSRKLKICSWWVLLSFSAHLFTSCPEESGVVEEGVARSRIDVALMGKLNQCQQAPIPFLLLVNGPVAEQDLQLCELSVINALCPISKIPFFCLKAAPISLLLNDSSLIETTPTL